MYDNGKGPYTFCKRGMSYCVDQQCNCVDSARYRAMYQSSREREGWSLSRLNPMRDGLLLVVCAVVGVGAGLVLIAAIILLVINNREMFRWAF